MVTPIDVITAYIIYFLPTITLSLLTVLIGLIVYYFGKKRNLWLMENTFSSISHGSGKRITELKLVEESTMGRTYLAEVKPDLSVTNFRIHFTMVHRHLILSKIASIIRKRRDYILLEADPSDKVVNRYQLEILPRREHNRIKKLVDMLGKLQTLEIRNPRFEESFIARVNDSDFFEAIFQKNKRLIQILFNQRNHIVRVSLYPLESPSIRVVAELNEQVNPKLLIDVIFFSAAAITSVAKKGFFAKQKAGLRVVPDKTLEKDKERFAKPYEKRILK
ncbi:MAG: hypothetical protein JSW11_16335 [Candidatus Heimdallarchaeota archaeon]|nr:MAG: hypothetical protein JSW11_16335 [Candidatus Heimdallarchaeota archaeon]